MIDHAIDCAKWDKMDSGKPFLRGDWPCTCQPQWTTTPPTEPGWYWWRDNCEAHPVKRKEPWKTEMVRGGEWWPIRIEEPK